MRLSFIQSAIRALVVTSVSSLAFAVVSHAQMGQQGGQQSGPVVSGTDTMQTELHMLTDVQTQQVPSKEREAYQAFYKVNPEDPDKKIQIGNGFLKKYPKSPYAEAVNVGMANAYYAKQDWTNFYATADSALALKPDDVDVLTLVGWVIPHFFDPSGADADKQLGKAETYEKHALDVLAKMPKPSGMSDSQFSAAKAQRQVQARSALGLIYFRRQDFDDSAKELQQSTQDNPSPDQTDLFVLGLDLQSMDRYRDAADAFDRCSQIPGSLRDRCIQDAELVKKQLPPAK